MVLGYKFYQHWTNIQMKLKLKRYYYKENQTKEETDTQDWTISHSSFSPSKVLNYNYNIPNDNIFQCDKVLNKWQNYRSEAGLAVEYPYFIIPVLNLAVYILCFGLNIFITINTFMVLPNVRHTIYRIRTNIRLLSYFAVLMQRWVWSPSSGPYNCMFIYHSRTYDEGCVHVIPVKPPHQYLLLTAPRRCSCCGLL